MIDIILNFFSAYYDEDMGIIDDHKVRTYLYLILLAYCLRVSDNLVHIGYFFSDSIWSHH